MQRIFLHIVLSLTSLSAIAQIDYSGDYTIGSGGDFTNVATAVSAINAGNVIGDVTFTIESGTYTETIDLRALNNGSFTVTFSGVDKTAIIQPNGDIDDAGLQIGSTSNLVFNNLTFDTENVGGSGFSGMMAEGAANLTFENVHFTNSFILGTSEGSVIPKRTISLINTTTVSVNSCLFDGAAYAHVWFDGFQDIEISLNDFYNGRDVITEQQNSTNDGAGLHISDNKIFGPFYNNGEAIIMAHSSSTSARTDIIIENNLIDGGGVVSAFASGMELGSASTVTIRNNVIRDTYNGILLNDISDLVMESNQIYNTYQSVFYTVSVSNSSFINNIIETQSRGAVFMYESTDLSFIHNTIYARADFNGPSGAQGVVVLQEMGGGLKVLNNIFGGASSITRGLYLENFAGNNLNQLELDYNLYDVNAVNALYVDMVVDGTAYSDGDVDLSTWVGSQGGFDQNSVSAAPAFKSAKNFHIANETDFRFGEFIATITEDVDGDERVPTADNKVDIGADQYTALTELCGNYTIGTSDADFPTFGEATAALQSIASTCDVTFTISAGDYDEALDLSSLLNGDFTVTFSGEDKESVIIQPNGTVDDAGILIDGANNLVLENFTLQTDDIAVDVVSAFNSDTLGIAIKNADNIQLSNILEANNGTLNGSTAEVSVVVLILESSNVAVESCDFSGVVGSHFWMENSHTISISDGDFSNHTYMNVSGSLSTTELTDLTIHNNDFWLSEFAFGSIYIDGLDAGTSFGFDLENNTFNNLGGFTGPSVSIDNVGSISFKKNTIDDGVILAGCDAVFFDSNTIFSTAENALGVSSCTDVHIFNNILSSEKLGVSFALGTSENVEFIHNTVYSKGLSGDSMFGSTQGERTIINNIFVGEGTDVPALTFSSVAPDFNDLLMEHNLYYAESAIAVQYRNTLPGGENTNFSLPEWQTESGQESNAQFFEPTFVSADDLHITSATQLRIGTYIDTLTMDIDGEFRVGALVDVGADQYAGYEINVSQEACESYDFDGLTLTTSGEYAATFTSTHGYDSLVNLSLTILGPTLSEETTEVCESYEWNGATYTTSGIFQELFTNAVGCDSTATLNLTILQPTSSEETTEVCESYEWNGTTYTESGVFQELFINTAGCDSTATLNLTILEPTSSEETTEVCESYEWNGVTYTASGIFQELFTNAVGCDSTAVLNLTIKPSVENTIEESACGSFSFNGSELTTSGTYDALYSSANGCDSLVHLNLTIHEQPDATVTQEGVVLFAVEDESYTYQWLDCDAGSDLEGATSNQLLPVGTGNYAVEVSNANCTVISDCFMVDWVTATDQMADKNVLVYPNMTSGFVTIELNKIMHEPTVQIWDVAGNLLTEQAIDQTGYEQLQMPQASGVYILRIFGDDQLQSIQRIIKSN